MDQRATVLRTEGVTKRFGAFVAVDRVDFTLGKDETVGIIGPNGAGKTTFLNLLTGYCIPDEGAVLFAGKDITGASPEKRVAVGIMRTFQLVRVFDNLDVCQNLGLAFYRQRRKSSFPLQMFVSNLDSPEVRHRVEETLRMFELGQIAREKAGNLALGSKRKLEIAMAFIADPVVLALDEPFAGLSDMEIDEMIQVIRKYPRPRTILIVEHKISKLLDLVDRLAVMNEGKIVANGPPKETLEDPEVRRVYWKVH